MTVSNTDQTMCFLFAVLLGFGFGLLYDCVSMLCAFFGMHRSGYFFSDIVLFLVCGLGSFLFFMIFQNGIIRVYPLLGMLLGVIGWQLTVGRVRRKAVSFLRKQSFSQCKLQKKRIVCHLLLKNNEKTSKIDQKISEENQISS